MNIQQRELYASPNGDMWYLCRETDGRPVVSHQPNADSGGKSSKIELCTFLSDGKQGPQQQALLQLIADLAGPGLPAEYDDHD
jgi:hypothetical protein